MNLPKNENNTLRSLLELDWITDDVVKLVFDILNGDSKNHKIHFLNLVITLVIKTLIDFEFMLPFDELEGKEYVFLPVSDSSSVHSIVLGSGSHWSLVLLDKNHKIFYQFDSLETNNLQHALAISQKLNNVYSPTVNISFLNVKTPRQENNVDCGMHTLLNAVTLAAEIQKDKSACLSLEIFEKC